MANDDAKLSKAPTTSIDVDDILRIWKGHLDGEIDHIAVLTSLCEQVEQKMAEIYRAKFPKSCGSCGRVFNSHLEYVEATNPTDKHGVRFDDFVNKVQEYRNCVCGSTLLLMVPDRRDMSPFGMERRELFIKFVDKIESLTHEPRPLIESKVREIIRKITKRASS